MCRYFDLDVLPFRPQLLPPLGGQVLVLGHDVLDRVPFDLDPLLAAVVLQLPEQVVPAPEVVEVLDHELPAELLVVREPLVRVLQQEGRPDALDVVRLVDLRGQRGEGLVQGVGGDAADGPAEDVALD